MPLVQPKSQRWRLLAAHLFLLTLCAAVVLPFVVVLSVSLRPGNFASGELIPSRISLEHWRYVLGLPYPGPDGRMLQPDLPVMRWLWNSVNVAFISGCVTLLLSTTASFALARMQFRGRRQLLNGLMLMQMFPAVLELVVLYTMFDRIGAAFVSKTDIDPAELRRGAKVVLGPIGTGEDLRAKAYPKHRAVHRGVIGHQAGEVRQIGVGLVVKGSLFAAEHDKGIGVDGLRQGLARPGLVEINQRGLFMQRHADLAVVGDPGVLDDGDAHGMSFG